MLKKTQYVHEQKLSDHLLLVNLLTFNFILLSRQDGEHWMNNDLDLLEKKESLIAGFFLVENDEFLLNKSFHCFGNRGNLLPSHVIFITDECNQSCPYCFEREVGSLGQIHRSLSTDNIDQIYKMIEQINGGSDCGEIILFGGESLLKKNKETIRYALEHARQMGLPKLQIVTNGTTIHTYKDIICEYSGQISSFIVTLNGYRSLHEEIRGSQSAPTFDLIINNIKLLLNLLPEIRIQINLLLEERNVDKIDELLSFLKYEGILGNKHVHLVFGRIQSRTQPQQEHYPCALPLETYYSRIFKNCLHSTLISDEMISGSELNILGDIYKHWKSNEFVFPHLRGCEAVYPGRFCYYVDGEIYPCTEIAGNRSYAIGSFLKGVLYDRKCAQWRQYSIKDNNKCNTCKYIGLCGGGCPVTNMEINASFFDTYCLHAEKALYQMINTLYEEGFFDECFIL